MSATVQHVDLAREDFDLAIRHGNGHWPGMHVTRLCSEQLFPVCSPQLAANGRLRQPGAIKDYPLLHVHDTAAWKQWLAHAGVRGVDPSRGLILSQASMAIDAAIDGQGIALARTALASWDLAAGRLIRPFPQALDAPYAFWIVCPKAMADVPKIATVRNWLLAEAQQDARGLVSPAARSSTGRPTTLPEVRRAARTAPRS